MRDLFRRESLQHHRAVASERRAVDVVIQTVEMGKRSNADLTVRRNGLGWVAALAVLVRDLDRGRVYDRDLPALAHELQQVLRSLERRPRWSRLFR